MRGNIAPYLRTDSNLRASSKLRSALDDLRDAEVDVDERFLLLSYIHAIHAEIDEAAKRQVRRDREQAVDA